MSLVFKYVWNETEPELIVAEGTVSEKERQELAGEVRRKYAQLAHKDKQRVAFETVLRAAPQPLRFYVRVQPGQLERCPNLVLLLVPAGTFVEGEADLPDWVAGFLKDVEELLGGTIPQADAAERTAFPFSVAELRGLAGQRCFVAPLLFVGYLLLARMMCRDFDADRAGLYRLNHRLAERFFFSKLPDEQAEPCDDEGGGQAHSLHWTASYLGWALGILGERAGGSQ